MLLRPSVSSVSTLTSQYSSAWPKAHRLLVRATCVVLLALSAIAGLPNSAAAQINLVFGTYAADKPSETVRKFRPLLDGLESALSRNLGEPVSISIHVANSYERGINELITGQVDFSRFGPASYVLAKDKQAAIKLLAMESSKGRKTFRGIICVHADSKIAAISDLKGRTFAFGSERSTIGRYLSQLVLMQNGIEASDLDRFDYLGRHDTVGMAVGRRDFDAGALKESTFKKLAAKDIPIRKIASFPNVTKPWIARAKLPARIADALRTELLGFTDKAALKALKKAGFLDAADADYDIIRQAIAQNPEFFK